MKFAAMRAALTKEVTKTLLASIPLPTPLRILPIGPDMISSVNFVSIFFPVQPANAEFCFVIPTTRARMAMASSFSCCVSLAPFNIVTRVESESSMSCVVKMYLITWAFLRASARAAVRMDKALPKLSRSTILTCLAMEIPVGAALRNALSSFMGISTSTSFSPFKAVATTSRPPWNVDRAWRMAKCVTVLTVTHPVLTVVVVVEDEDDVVVVAAVVVVVVVVAGTAVVVVVVITSGEFLQHLLSATFVFGLRHLPAESPWFRLNLNPCWEQHNCGSLPPAVMAELRGSTFSFLLQRNVLQLVEDEDDEGDERSSCWDPVWLSSMKLSV